MACYYYVPFPSEIPLSLSHLTLTSSTQLTILPLLSSLAAPFLGNEKVIYIYIDYVTFLVTYIQPFLGELEQHFFGVDVLKAAGKSTSVKLLDAFVDSAFQFVDYPLDPSQVYI